MFFRNNPVSKGAREQGVETTNRLGFHNHAGILAALPEACRSRHSPVVIEMAGSLLKTEADGQGTIGIATIGSGGVQSRSGRGANDS